jgi:hypothetical protein
VLYAWNRDGLPPDVYPLITPRLVARVWGDPALLRLGLSFSLPVLIILFVHEMGHYLACRHYRLPSTLPYFLPLPAVLGTLGAFIRIRAPIRGKRELFDVGVAGPFAGFLALLPFLLYGVARSQPAPLRLAAGASRLVPGQCLAMELATRIFHGPLGDGMVLRLHPFALAAWFGLLATAINLLPLGQLDGGHILYAVAGRWQRRLALPLWVALALAGLLWGGWLVWCVVIFAMGLYHPPLLDEAKPLDNRRRALAAAALVVLALCFTPRGATEPSGDEAAAQAGERRPPGFAGQPLEVRHQRHRAVVDQRHLHAGAEAAGLDLAAAPAQLLDQRLDQRRRRLGRRGAVERGPPPARQRAGQRELGHHQEGASGRRGVEVHLARRIVEDAQPGQLVGRRQHRRAPIPLLDADQHQQAAADRAHRLAGDAHRRGGDTLDHQAHARWLMVFPSSEVWTAPRSPRPRP